LSELGCFSKEQRLLDEMQPAAFNPYPQGCRAYAVIILSIYPNVQGEFFSTLAFLTSYHFGSITCTSRRVLGQRWTSMREVAWDLDSSNPYHDTGWTSIDRG
jgi:hypothetical protein